MKTWKILVDFKKSQLPFGWMFGNLVLSLGFIALQEGLRQAGSQGLEDFENISKQAYLIYQLLFPFVSIVGGFYTRTTYNRWWTMRDGVRVVMGGGIDAAMHISANIKSAQVRKELIRYILLAQALLMWTMRTTLGDKDGDGDLDAEDIRIKDPTTGEYVTNLEDWLTAQVTKHVCTEPEKEAILKSAAPFHLPYQWFLMMLARASESGRVTNPVASHLSISLKIHTMRSNATKVIMHLNTPTPFPYFHQFLFITLGTLVLTPLAMAGISDVHEPGVYVVEALGTLIASFFVASLWAMAVLLTDPFGFDVCDFNIEGDFATSEKVMAQQINAVDDFPDVPELYKDPFAFPPAYEYPTASLNALGALAGSQLATQFAQQYAPEIQYAPDVNPGNGWSTFSVF
jgi:predicted membrane chloride channel (bestrophin family)